MQFRMELDKARNMSNVILEWGIQREYEEIWGVYSLDNEKVKTSKKHDALENRIIKRIDELGKNAERYINVFKKMYVKLYNIINHKARTPEDKKILIQYLQGYELNNILFPGTVSALWKALNNAIEYIQELIDQEGTISKLPDNIQKVINGSRAKCKKCGAGHIYYLKENDTKYMFKCDQCENRLSVYKYKYV